MSRRPFDPDITRRNVQGTPPRSNGGRVQVDGESVDLRWLSASERDVAEEMARLRNEGRPSWMPRSRRWVVVHVNHSLMLWYLGIAWVTLGVRIDTIQDGYIGSSDVRDMVIVSVIFLAWCFGTYWLHRWAHRPPSRRSRMQQWRQTLTAHANGFDSSPTRRARLSSLMTAETGKSFVYPRFVASGIEFGNLTRRRNSSGQWRYLAVTLREPLPHIVLNSTTTNGVAKLPVHMGRTQELSLGGEFDRSFRLFVPEEYERDALFVLAPNVMAALIDHAPNFSIEMVENTVVFFAPAPADFTTPEAWLEVAEALQGATPPLAATADRYRDDRGQHTSGMTTSIQAATDRSNSPRVEPSSQIGPKGTRLKLRDHRSGGWAVLRAIGWGTALAFFYAVPGIFAFAGFMSIIDGH